MAVAIILAAGSGSRMKSDIPKQFMKIEGKELIYYSLTTFQNHGSVSDIILVTSDADIEFCRNDIVERYGFDKVKKVVAGGKERYDSVYNGLKALDTITDDKNIPVLIHDGARPMVTKKMISDSIMAIDKGDKSCTVAVPVKDTIKITKEENGKIVSDSTPERNNLYQIQTPQTFLLDLIEQAYEKMQRSSHHNITDDTMLVEQYMGVKTSVILGDYTNIKITTPEDLETAKIFLKKFKKMC